MNIIDAVNNLNDLISTGGATENSIFEAENELGVSFANEYKLFLQEFGSILADDVELVGIAKSKHRNVVEVTKKEREYNSLVPHNMYVIENTGIEGVIIWQDESGKIYQSSPNSFPKKIYDSLVEYLTKR